MDSPLVEPRSLFLLGCELMDAERLEDAVRAFSCAIDNDPKARLPIEEQLAQPQSPNTSKQPVTFSPSDATYSSAKSFLNRALLQGRLGRWAEAADDHQQLAKICPDYRGHAYEHARCLAQLSRQQAALNLRASARKTILHALTVLEQHAETNESDSPPTANPLDAAQELSLSDLHAAVDVHEQLAAIQLADNQTTPALEAITHCIRYIQKAWPQAREQLAHSGLEAWRRSSRATALRLQQTLTKLASQLIAVIDLLALAGPCSVLARCAHRDLELWDLSGQLYELADTLMQRFTLADSAPSLDITDETTARMAIWYTELLIASGRTTYAQKLLQRAIDALQMENSATKTPHTNLIETCKTLARMLDASPYNKQQSPASDTATENTALISLSPAADLENLWRIDTLGLVDDDSRAGELLAQQVDADGTSPALSMLDRLIAGGLDLGLAQTFRSAILARDAYQITESALLADPERAELAWQANTRAMVDSPNFAGTIGIRAVLAARSAVAHFTMLQNTLTTEDSLAPNDASAAEHIAHHVRHDVEACLEALSRMRELRILSSDFQPIVQLLHARFEPLYPQMFEYYDFLGMPSS